ncbi:MAG: hypothetical protein ACHQRM_11185 [Bacteroidia bacterium]
MKNIFTLLRSALRRLTPWHWFLVFSLLFIQFESQRFNNWRHSINKSPFVDDAEQYYAYLPATFIYHHLDFQFPNGYWCVAGKNGKRVPKYTFGVALLETPFFIAGHTAARLLDYPLTGYSEPYSRAACGAVLCYVFLGLFCLYKALIRYVDPRAAALTLFILFYATNLFYYSVSFPLMSHAFSFSMFSVFVYAWIRCIKDRHLPSLFLASAAAGMIVLIRPPDLLLLLFPLLMGISDFRAWKEGWFFLFRKKGYLALSALFFLLLCFLQPLYWYLITDTWFINGYDGERFFFRDPQVINFLFSCRKGLIPYAPVMIFSLLGFIALYRRCRELFWPVLGFTVINVYVLSCWWDWTFGGSLGNRALIQSFALLAFPLAALIHACATCFRTVRARLYSYAGMFAVACFFVVFNLSLVHKYRSGVIHWDDMNKQAYWYMLPKWDLTPDELREESKLWKPMNPAEFKKGIGRDDKP